MVPTRAPQSLQGRPEGAALLSGLYLVSERPATNNSGLITSPEAVILAPGLSVSSIDSFSLLLSDLYEAAASPFLWERFLERFKNALSGTHVYMTAVPVQDGPLTLILEGYSASDISAYTEYYRSVDLVLESGLQAAAEQGEWIGTIDDRIPRAEFENTEIYNDYCLKVDLYRQAGMGFGAAGPYSFSALATWRPRGSREFDANDLHLLRLLAPHFRQAVALSHRMGTLRTENQVLQSGLEASGMLLFALDSSGRIVSATRRTQLLTQERDGLERAGGRLKASPPVLDRKLQGLIAGACATGSRRVKDNHLEAQSGGALLIPRSNGRKALQVFISPFRTAQAELPSGVAALVFISDPEIAQADRGTVLKELFGLSPVESRLTQLLLQGYEVKQVADSLSMSYEASRYHLKQIFRKTGTRRQSELMRLLSGIPGSIR